MADPHTWSALVTLAILVVACGCLGVTCSRRIGLIEVDEGRGTQLAIGLALGLLIVTSGYATIRSAGGSAFAPTVILTVLAVASGRNAVGFGRPRGWFTSVAAVIIIASAIAAVYGVTISPAEREGAQPVEFMDEAFYGVLGSTLRDTGVESVYSPAGLGPLPGQPAQTWYHWGEIWLAALVIDVRGAEPMDARHLVALPLIIAATVAVVAATASSLVARRRSNEVRILAAVGMASIAPIPLVLDWHFDWWARPIGFSATTYGFAYLPVALGMYAILRRRPATSSGTRWFGASLVACLVASHIAIAGLAAVAISIAAIVTALDERRRERERWRPDARLCLCLAGAASLSIAWGTWTGHGLASDGAMVDVEMFGPAWQRAIILVTTGAGVLVLGVAAAVIRSRREPTLSALAVGAIASATAGAAFWGLRAGDFNAFHVFFGSIAVLVTPVVVVATVGAVAAARDRGRQRSATTLIVILLTQSAIGISATAQRLYQFGPGHYQAIPTDTLDFVRSLPDGSRLAYSCQTFEEVAVWDARLISITAHTGRSVVPMCFQADRFRLLHGKVADPWIANPFFMRAPQRELYPTFDSRPSAAEVLAFLHRFEVRFIWVDPDHPNGLVPNATVVHRNGEFAVLRVPSIAHSGHGDGTKDSVDDAALLRFEP